MCTKITGDCNNFCGAVDNLTPLAGCTQMKADYLACLGTPADVCQHDCAIELADLRACLGSYCAGDPFDTDCQTLKNSFN
jgi:hypothetical protein